MTLYLDTSHLVKLYVDEPDSAEVRDLVAAADVVAVSALAYPETRATLRRRRAEQLMTPAEYAAALSQFDEDWPRMLVLGCDADLIAEAGVLADRHSIRGADAVHLAAFERVVANDHDGNVQFSCADARLNQAAKDLG